MASRIVVGDCRAVLASLPANSVQCCVTSPPYFGLRDYGVAGQIGLEASPDAYVAALVKVFGQVRRVLRPDGVCFVVLGDSYARKDLLGIPWRVAFALQSDGRWWLRSAIVWHKPNPMPESVTDRCTSAYEMVFMLTKSERYFFDAAAIAEPALQPVGEPRLTAQHKRSILQDVSASRLGTNQGATTRNARNVWTIATQPYSGAHFAVFPPALAERCILAGSRAGDTVLDPFAGAGTTLLVADRLGRNGIGIELNPVYATLARNRIAADGPLFAEVAD